MFRFGLFSEKERIDELEILLQTIQQETNKKQLLVKYVLKIVNGFYQMDYFINIK